jgi:hypothetical protein
MKERRYHIQNSGCSSGETAMKPRLVEGDVKPGDARIRRAAGVSYLT